MMVFYALKPFVFNNVNVTVLFLWKYKLNHYFCILIAYFYIIKF